jgi:predicted permease
MGSNMEETLLKAGSFVLIIISSYLLKKVGLFDWKDNRAFMKLIMNVTLPGAVIASFSNYEKDASLIFVAILGLGMNILLMVIGYLVAFRSSREEKAFNVINFSGYNIGTFAMPYLQSFLGPVAIIVTCLFDAGNAIMCTGVTYAVASNIVGEKNNNGIKAFLKKIFSSVPFDVYTIMLIFYFAEIRMPSEVYKVASVFGSANAFLAMFMIGGALEINLNKNLIKKIGITLSIRYLCAATASYIFYTFLPYSLTVRQVLAILVFSPITSMSVINTAKCNGDHKLSGTANSISILISLIIITVLITSWGLG